MRQDYSHDAWDPLHKPGTPGSHWTTDNIGEAAPGVLSPLAASIWSTVGNRMAREVPYAMGVFRRSERSPTSTAQDETLQMFYGRIAMRLEYLAGIGNRMPGITGEEAVRGLFGRVPETMAFATTRRRYPFIAYKLPRAMVMSPRDVRASAVEVDGWWRSRSASLPTLDRSAAAALLKEGVERFDRGITAHSLALLSAIQPLHQALLRLVDRAGVGDIEALSGTGGAEMAIIADIWRASRGELTLQEVVANHGFHGPYEGEISSHVWREDPSPVQRMIEVYAGRDETQSPLRRQREHEERLPSLQREVIAALPRSRRADGRIILALAARVLPLRGVGKRSYLQSLDLARGAARRLGQLFAESGHFRQPDDAFYLTLPEVVDTLPADVAQLVAKRRERRSEYQRLRIPGGWRGVPVPVAADDSSAADESKAANSTSGPTIAGVGVSAGVVEGRARVVLDPSFADIEPGEVLVTPTTDPSWASIMFISSALVVDIGGVLSHAAVVARELRLPCVVNTRDGSQVLRTGDRVRVDGSRGTVEVLERSTAA